MTVYILNALIFPFKGKSAEFSVRQVTVDEARKVITNGFVSAIGHQSTAEMLTILLNTQIPANRVSVYLEPGDKALIFQLNRRLEEGKVLQTVEEIEQIGYTLYLLERKL